LEIIGETESRDKYYYALASLIWVIFRRANASYFALAAEKAGECLLLRLGVDLMGENLWPVTQVIDGGPALQRIMELRL
jgi:hypothetical protein